MTPAEVKNANQYGIFPGGKGKKRKNIEQTMRDSRLYNMYSNKFAELSIGSFEWKNMGEFFDSRFAEAELFYNGRVTIWYSKELNSFLCGQTTPGSEVGESKSAFDIYGRLIYNKIFAVNGYQTNLDTSNSVIIYDSSCRVGCGGSVSDMPMSPYMMLMPTIDDLVRIRKTLRVNLNALNIPIIVRGSEDDMLTMQNLVNQYDSRDPYIFINKNAMDDTPIAVLQTKVDSHVTELSEQLHRFEAEGMSILGINNVAFQKNERMLTDEVNANNESLSIVMKDRLNSRRMGLKRLNRLFGTNCKVSAISSSNAVNTSYNFGSQSGYTESADENKASGESVAEGGSGGELNG